jgi:hypothetical protein
MSKRPQVEHPRFDRNQPEGAYRSDAFFERFTPGFSSDKPEDHISINLLRESYSALKPEEAAPGIDGETWQSYGEKLEEKLKDLCERMHSGSYRSHPDEPGRPFSIWCLEDKIVQQAVVTVLEAHRRPHFQLFRFDVERAVRVAQIRAQREDETEPTRRQAFVLLEVLAALRPELERLARFDSDVNFAVQLSAVFQPVAGKKTPADIGRDIRRILIHLFDILRAPMGSGDGSYLLQWLRELEQYEVVPRLPPRRAPLTRHLVEQVIAVYERRIRERPPASRRHWLGQFLAALWRDLHQSLPEGMDEAELDDFFGKKVEDAVRRTVSRRA